jgi:hypothetical protein
MDYEELKRLVFEAAYEEDGRTKLTCAQAFGLAEAHGVQLLDISRVCNREGIRFARCQLGCFK